MVTAIISIGLIKKQRHNILELFLKKKEPEYTVSMSYDKSKPCTKRNIINFIKDLGIEVKTNTKARGNNGIYHKNRIDIAKGLKDEKAIEVLVHEFAHYIHSKIDKDFNKTGGSLSIAFNTDNPSIIKTELINVTNLLDKKSKTAVFTKAKDETASTIKSMQRAIQREYPDFQRSKKFKEFDKYIKNSDAKYLVKYDAIRIVKGFFVKKEKILSIKNLYKDFPDMPKAFKIYIELCSMQRKQSRLSRRINKMNKYFDKPTELFARYVQGFFSNPETISTIAPETTKQFIKLLNSGYYGELKEFFEVFCPDLLNKV